MNPFVWIGKWLILNAFGAEVIQILYKISNDHRRRSHIVIARWLDSRARHSFFHAGRCLILLFINRYTFSSIECFLIPQHRICPLLLSQRVERSINAAMFIRNKFTQSLCMVLFFSFLFLYRWNNFSSSIYYHTHNCLFLSVSFELCVCVCFAVDETSRGRNKFFLYFSKHC